MQGCVPHTHRSIKPPDIDISRNQNKLLPTHRIPQVTTKHRTYIHICIPDKLARNDNKKKTPETPNLPFLHISKAPSGIHPQRPSASTVTIYHPTGKRNGLLGKGYSSGYVCYVWGCASGPMEVPIILTAHVLE